jgi:acetylornithine/N-succinyldiaminopimelate aminotransferase
VRGAGCRLWDENGKSYLDFCTGIAVCSLGHCHPRLVEAIREQAGNLLHCSNLYQIPQQAELAEEINTHHVRIPGKVFFSNSGAEANDGLIKSARRFGHKRPQADGAPRFEVITFRQSFHGRTLGSMSATGQAKIQEGFDPLLPGFRHLPFNDVAALEAGIRPETAAILLEPIQGEGGVNVPRRNSSAPWPPICKKHDLLLFFDEVQAGFGRCGDCDGMAHDRPGNPARRHLMGQRHGRRRADRRVLAQRPRHRRGHPAFLTDGPRFARLDLRRKPARLRRLARRAREIREKELAANAILMEVRIRKPSAPGICQSSPNPRQGTAARCRARSRTHPHSGRENPALVVVAKLMEHGLVAGPPAGPNTIRLLPPSMSPNPKSMRRSPSSAPCSRITNNLSA